MTRSAAQIRSLILDTHARLKRDHFEVLGLERTATEAEIREAYGGFARVLHPDACHDPALEDLREKREAVFIRLSDAYEVLRDPASRAEYERAFEPSKLRSPRAAAAMTREAPGPDPPPAPVTPPPAFSSPPATPASPKGTSTPPIDERLMPERILEIAKQRFEDGDYWEAIRQLEPIVPRAEEPTRARAKMLLARAYMKNPKWRKRAEGVLQSLLDDDRRDVAACLVLAELYRDAHLPARARALYRRVLDIQPGHDAAASALAALEPQAEEAPAPSGFAGLFKRR